MIPEWTRIYPDLGTVMRAPLPTLKAWHANLPAPQTDVERTVHRRLHKRVRELVLAECRASNPEAVEVIDDFETIINRIDDAFERVLGGRRA